MQEQVNCPYYLVTKEGGLKEYYAYLRTIKLRDSNGFFIDACIFRNNCMKKRKIHFNYIYNDDGSQSIDFPDDMNCMLRFRAEMTPAMWEHIKKYKAQLIQNAKIKLLHGK
jgi:hypothetical protein